MANWFCVQTRPNAEFRAVEDLRREELMVWLPHTYTRVTPKRWGYRPHYPRYCFVYTTDTRLWLAKHHKCSVVTLATNEHGDRLPAIIPNDVMQVLQAGFDASGLALTRTEAKRARFTAMERVRYREGHPYRDLLVRVIEDDGSDRVRVLLSIFGHLQKATVSAADLEAA
jgi:hypothetical protein